MSLRPHLIAAVLFGALTTLSTPVARAATIEYVVDAGTFFDAPANSSVDVTVLLRETLDNSGDLSIFSQGRGLGSTSFSIEPGGLLASSGSTVANFTARPDTDLLLGAPLIVPTPTGGITVQFGAPASLATNSIAPYFPTTTGLISDVFLGTLSLSVAEEATSFTITPTGQAFTDDADLVAGATPLIENASFSIDASTFTVNAVAVPEPSAALGGLTLLALTVTARRARS